MIARLLGDAIWRNRWFYVSTAAALLPFWHLFDQKRPSALPISVTALSLILALVMGPVFTIASMGLRALRHLPFSNRDLWRATWILATVVPPAVLLVTKTLSALLVMAFGGDSNVSAEMVLLFALYDFAWTGALLPVFPSLIFAESAADDRGRVAAAFVEVARGVGLLACFGLPVLASDSLPTHVGEFTPVTAVMLIAALALAFGTLAWTPRRGLLAGERGRPQSAFPPPRAATRRRVGDRLTGIPRLAVPYLLTTLALPVGACFALAAYGVLSGSGAWWFVPAAVFDPANTGDRGLTYVVAVSSVCVAMQSLWSPWARLLKVLPLSVRQINALLLFTPFAPWTILWLLGWSAYAFAYGPPRTLRLDVAFGMASISALAHACLLRVQGSSVSVLVLVFLGGLITPLAKAGLRDGTGAQLVFVLIGTIALCAAAWVNHRTLTRSTSASRAYRPPYPPFGMAKPLSIR